MFRMRLEEPQSYVAQKNISTQTFVGVNCLNSFMTMAEVPIYHIETGPLICTANQWTGFCMIGTSVMKEFKILFEHS